MTARVSSLLACTLIFAAIYAPACSSKSTKPTSDGGAGESAIVVGVQGDQVAGVIQTVHITTSVNGVAATDDTLNLATNPTALPKEIRLTPPAGSVDGTIDVTVEGYPTPTLTKEPPAFSRRAHAAFIPGEEKLLRIEIDNRCIVAGPGGPPCTGNQTCIAGSCQDATVPPEQLEDYSSSWPQNAPDFCKPAGHGDPVVVVGTGQTDFLPITDGQTLQAERGPQGGHHIWIATRVKNLKQSGSTTTIVGTQPATGVSIPPTVFVFTFDPDEGGYCKLYGLRYQLDNGGIDYKQFLGKPLDVTVTVQDPTGLRASATAHINVAPTVLGD
jgi:hypothetical protein